MKNKAYLLVNALVILIIVATMTMMIFNTNQLIRQYISFKEKIFQEVYFNEKNW